MKVCTKCKRPLGDGDKYCKYCGVSRRETEYEPIRGHRGFDIMSAVYGPPYYAKHVCPKCGNVYIESGLGSPSARFCSECGAEYVTEESGRGFGPPSAPSEDESELRGKTSNAKRNKK